MRIAVDAMGGDRAPDEIVRGAVLAAREFGQAHLLLVGDQGRIESILAELGALPDNVSIHHASEVVGMEEAARVALREKRDSSIARAVGLVADGSAEAVVSAGNTGAAVALSTLRLRPLPGVQRAGIAVTLPTLEGACILIDAGANISCKPEHLLQYGIMASVYSEIMLGTENPKVGLLNIGEEGAKGNALVKQTYALLAEADLNFVGNVEGDDIYTGECDVIVCEGFAGNVILKTSEGLAEAMLRMIKGEIMSQWSSRLGGWLCKPAFRRVRSRIDFSEYGGEPLLGLNGVSMIGHGRSDAKAMFNAVRQTCRVIEARLNANILARLQTQQPCPPA